MTQFLIEEAAFLALDIFEAREHKTALAGAEQRDRLEAMARRAVSGGLR